MSRRAPAPARVLAIGFLTLGCVPLCGCLLAEPIHQTWAFTKNTFKPRGVNDVDTTEKVDHTWRGVADEGRRGHKVEKDPDQWYRNYFMSEKAREVERNFGIE